ncbi:MAG: saccharopine dehydrogenase family protein [bacterium]|nr:saccharopine dehydrogenase family protein [bacterium]
MKKNVLIIGAGGVGHVVAHKCAQNNDILGDICIASRRIHKCNTIIESIERKNNIKDKSKNIYSREIDAKNIPALIKLIEETNSQIVINVGISYINMSVLEACIETGAVYMDTAIHEEPDKVCEDPPWYGNYEWKRKDRCLAKGITAILSVGFDPGVVNAYAAYAKKHLFDKITQIDIYDVNAGDHGRYFATNFDPEINFREFTKVWTWVNGKWVAEQVHKIWQEFDFPEIGVKRVYLSGHDELHSLAVNMKEVPTIRFWMGFSDHYINVFTVLTKLGLLSEKPIKLPDGIEVIPLRVVKAVLPDPLSLAKDYKGKVCIGNLVKGIKNGKEREVFIFNLTDHEYCYKDVEAQAVSYTAGVPPVAAAILVAKGIWDVKKMVNVEELDPDPFLRVLNEIGLPTKIRENGLISDVKP